MTRRTMIAHGTRGGCCGVVARAGGAAFDDGSARAT